MKQYSVVGNKKKVTMETNTSSLKVVGNSCIVRVKSNQGNIEVVGNDCSVEVTDNYGNVNLVGANGRVTIAKRWNGDSVQVIGLNCRLTVGGQKKMPSCGYEAQLSPFSKDLDDVIDSIFTFVMR